MKRILVGVDGSTGSRAAADGAATMARLLGETLVLVAVVEPPRLPAAGAPMGPRPALVYRGEADARALLSSESQRLAEAGVVAETELRYGRTAHELAAMAQREDVELVVVGRHATGLFSRALQGSLESRLLHECSKPVLVFPER